MRHDGRGCQPFEAALDRNGHHLSIGQADVETQSSKMTNIIARRKSPGRFVIKFAVAVGDEQNNR